MIKENQKVLLMAFCGILMVTWTYKVWAGKPWGKKQMAAFKEADQRNFYCESCGHIFCESYRKISPQACPKCGHETAVRTQMARCKACQSVFPFVFFQWSPKDKMKWESLLATQELTQADGQEYENSRYCRFSGGDWRPNSECPPILFPSSCPTCRNSDPVALEVLDLPNF